MGTVVPILKGENIRKISCYIVVKLLEHEMETVKKKFTITMYNSDS